MKKFLLLLVVTVLSVGLAGCGMQTMSSYSLDASVPEHPKGIWATQVTFPNGETANIVQIRPLDARTRRPIQRGDIVYAFNGKTWARAIVDDVAGSLVMAGGAVGGAQILSHSGPLLVNNVHSMSGALANATSHAAAGAAAY